MKSVIVTKNIDWEMYNADKIKSKGFRFQIAER